MTSCGVPIRICLTALWCYAPIPSQKADQKGRCRMPISSSHKRLALVATLQEGTSLIIFGCRGNASCNR